MTLKRPRNDTSFYGEHNGETTDSIISRYEWSFHGIVNHYKTLTIKRPNRFSKSERSFYGFGHHKTTDRYTVSLTIKRLNLFSKSDRSFHDFAYHKTTGRFTVSLAIKRPIISHEIRPVVTSFFLSFCLLTFITIIFFQIGSYKKCFRKVSDLRSYLRVGTILRHPDRGIRESSPRLIEPHAPSGVSTS